MKMLNLHTRPSINERSILWQNTIRQKQPPEVFCKKKVFLEILQNSQENICAKSLF